MKGILRKLVERVVRGCARLQCHILRRTVKWHYLLLLTQACKAAEDEAMSISFRLKPKNPSEIPCLNLNKNGEEKTAIILQGPVRHEDEFTLKTVQFYRQAYPDAYVIVSTWKDEDAECIKKLKSAGAMVVLNEKPAYGGHLNVNYQLVSTRGGIDKARELKAAYVAKTRTDQRICRQGVLPYMMNLIKTYEPIDSSKQTMRLVALSMNYGKLFSPYFMSDFFYFGSLEEVEAVFSVPLDAREPFKLPEGSTKREHSRVMYAPEIYLMKNYLVSKGCSGDDSIKDYWEGVQKYLVCVDIKTLDIAWPKYDEHYQYNAFAGEFFLDDSWEKLKTMNFDFINWFNLYTGAINYHYEYEKYADARF